MLPILTHTIGDDRDYDFTIVDRAGAAEDISTWAFWFTVKRAPADLDADALFQLTLENGGIVLDVPVSGIGVIRIRAADTKGKTAGKFFCDFQCRKGAEGAHIETLLSGTFKLTDEITRAE